MLLVMVLMMMMMVVVVVVVVRMWRQYVCIGDEKSGTWTNSSSKRSDDYEFRWQKGGNPPEAKSEEKKQTALSY
jgi:hypothetical protein